MDSPAADDNDLILSASTQAALNEFLQEREQKQMNGHLDEDWQLSQFWYTEETCRQLVNECIRALNGKGTVACLCCPSLIPHFLEQKVEGGGVFLRELADNQLRKLRIRLFEFDSRFGSKFPEIFTYYDYNKPLLIDNGFHNSFDLIIADPPFLSDECLVKVAQTVRQLAKPGKCKLLINTGAVMEDLVQRLLDGRNTGFKPEHKNNLANEFVTFANYTTSLL